MNVGEAPADPGLYDPVTSLPTPALQREHLRHALRRAQRAGTRVALLLLDVDNLHQRQPDTGAHHALVGELAQRLQTTLRNTDVISPIDQGFVIICEDVEEAADIGELIKRINSCLFEPIDVDGSPVVVRATIGSALSTDVALDNKAPGRQ